MRKHIKIKLNGQHLPVQHGEWIDLTTAEDVDMKQFDFKIISLGICMKVPRGYYCEIVPRSSTYKKYGIFMANSVGIIEDNYCGDEDVWGFPAIALRDTKIAKGTRICQFRLVKKAPRVKFHPVQFMKNKSRGGFGSTGV